MIVESILIVAIALAIDITLGDPKNKYHPTAWIGILAAKIIPLAKNRSQKIEKFYGVLMVISICTLVSFLLLILNYEISLISNDIIHIIIFIIAGSILLKSTIAIRGMEKHALDVVNSIINDDISQARANLSKIVKRDTKNLDKNHVLSGVLESISENTVDGITSPLFYFAIFGLPGAFVYRIINTFDSMIGYKTMMFNNLGWFSANSDKILNYIPARLTGFVMILSAMIIKIDWRQSYEIMLRDCRKPESLNAGYPIAALAGALGTKFEKIDHYVIGDGNLELTISHIKSAISLMKVTSILFFMIITIPIIVGLSYLGWNLYA